MRGRLGLVLICGAAVGSVALAGSDPAAGLPTISISPRLHTVAAATSRDVPLILINEVDADNPSTDTAEFIELYDGGIGSTALDGLVLVFYNGSGDTSYNAFDLDGQSTDGSGFFVLCGDAAFVPACDLDVAPDSNLLQNGADAVALYIAEGTDFPFGSDLTTVNLVDALVYGTSDPDDAELLALLNAGQPQVDESGGGDSTAHSNQRCPDGGGGARNTSSYLQNTPTPGAANRCGTLVINELDYDQPSTDYAEFIELENVSSQPLDLDPYSIVLVNGSNGAIYQTIDLPAALLAAGDFYVVCADSSVTLNCDLDVTPDSNLIQNGPPDAVALVFDAGGPGESQVDVVSYEGDVSGYVEGSGSGLVDDGSAADLGLSRYPDGSDTDQNNVDFALRCISPGATNLGTAINCQNPGAPVEITEIQGDGVSSPFEHQLVLTEQNVVTALRSDGFFIQTPDARDDLDPDTSNGLFVYTGSAPIVAVGDLVDVTGQVMEFFGFTEISSPTDVTVVDTGVPLPTAVTFDATTPSPDPSAPSCAVELECYEGMLVEITGGVVTGSNQSFGGDPIAEVYITATGNRAFREPGVLYPGLGGGIPTWDGNPEVFELDPDQMGLVNERIPAGSTFDAVGVLGFEFDDYELWPTALSVDPAVLPRPVRGEAGDEYTVGSLNLFRLFDAVDDGGEETVAPAVYQTRLAKLSRYIREVLRSPDVLAVQEAEKLDVLSDLAARINTDDASVDYTAYLVEGNDAGGIDVGFLVQGARFQVDGVTQLGAAELLTYDSSLLHDRPPLLMEGRFDPGGVDLDVALLVVHNRSLSGIDDPTDGARVRQKRLEQAQSIAQMVQGFQTADTDTPLLVLGDFNAFEFTDGYVDVIGQIRGEVDPTENLLSGPDLVSPDMTDKVLRLPAEERYSFVFEGSAQLLDHVLVTSELSGVDGCVRELQLGRANADAAEDHGSDSTSALRASDHDGLVVFLVAQPCLVFADDFESGDTTAWTAAVP